MTSLHRPPRWAEAVLALLLTPDDAETVSGDLLEEYREHVRPVRGAWRANVWYVTQVFGFLWRGGCVWGVLQGAAMTTRSTVDHFVPPADFHFRSAVTTYTAAAIFVSAGFWAAWRSDSLRLGTVAGIVASAISAAISIIGAILLIAFWHDPQTLTAIRHSGGLGEEFVLPVMLIVPATLLATAGAVIGKLLRVTVTRLES